MGRGVRRADGRGRRGTRKRRPRHQCSRMDMPTKRYDRTWSEWAKYIAHCPYCGGAIPTLSECGRCGDLKALDVKYERWTKVPYRRPHARRIDR